MLCGNNDTAQLGWEPQAQSIPEHLKGLTVEGEAGVSVTVPARVATLEAFSVHHVAVGLTHVCAVVGDGMLTTWGGNDSGQLGGSFAPLVAVQNAWPLVQEGFVARSCSVPYMSLTKDGRFLRSMCGRMFWVIRGP